MPVTKSSPDGGKTTYYENPDLAAKLRSKGVKAEAGKRSSNMTQAQRQAKSREYAARPQPQRGNSRGQRGNGAASPVTQPVARPNGAQGPLMQNGNYGMGGNSTPLAGSPPGAFAQRGAPAQPAYNPLPQNQPTGAPPQPMYNPLPTYSTQPVQRPSVFRQPNSSVTMGIQGLGQVNPYGASMNPAQVMGGYQPPVSNPWRRQW